MLLMAVWITSCAPKKVLTDGAGAHVGKEYGADKLASKIIESQTAYTWFAGTGQGKIDWDGQRMSATVNVRIYRDSIIWVQISKLGFEVGRMLVTPDSAFFINRLERSYSLYRTIDFLEEYNVPADFDMFSAVFTGGAYVPEHDMPFQLDGTGALVTKANNGANAAYWFDSEAQLIRSTIIDPLAREWSAGYMDYQPLPSGVLWPFKRSNTLVMDGEASVFDLEYRSIEVDVPQSFPFSIPSHYEKI